MTSNKLKQGILALTVLGMCTIPLAALAQERIPENTITVQGNGAVTAKPDSMQLQAGFENDGKTMEAARNTNAEHMNAVIARIKALGIPGLVLQTTGFSIYPIRDEQLNIPSETRGRTPKIVGYTVHNNISIKLEGADPEHLSEYATRIIDTAVTAGANTTSGPNFYMSRNSKAPQEALRLAIQQAHQNAEVVAEASGVKLTGIFNIEAYAQPIAMRMAPSMAAEGAMMKSYSTPIESGDFDVTANVTVRYDFQD